MVNHPNRSKRKREAEKAKGYYDGYVRVVKNGVPCRMPAWYGELSGAARSSILSGNIDAPYPASAKFKG